MSNAVVATILRTECDFTPDMTGEQIIREAFKKAKQHWMEPNENNQFSAACAVAYVAMNAEDKARMELSVKIMKAVSAMLSGVPVDMEAVMSLAEGVETFPLQTMWSTP